jgi:hypothetical protein
LVANDDLATLDANIDPTTSAVPTQSKTSVVLPSYDGLILDWTWASNNALQVEVPQGTLQDFEVNISGLYAGVGVVSLGLDVLRLNENTGEYELYEHIPNAGTAFAALVGFYTGGTTINDLPEGQYAIVMTNDQGLNFTGLGFPTLTIPSGGVATDYGEVVVSGNVIVPEGPGDVADVDPEGQPLVVTQVISETGNTLTVDQSVNDFQKIEGAYGDLYIDKDGNYEYIRNPEIPNSVGKVDTFTYTIQDVDGNTATANLNIRIDSSQVDINWPTDPTLDGTVDLVATNDINGAQVDYTNFVETKSADLGSMTASVTRTGSLFGGYTYTRNPGTDTSDVVTVDPNASAVLSIKVTTTDSSGANNDTFGYSVQKLVGGSWQTVYVSPTTTYSHPFLGGSNATIIDNSYSIPADSVATQWRVVYTSTESNESFLVNGTNTTTVQTSVQPTLTHYDVFTASGEFTPATGNIITDDSGNGTDVTGGVGTKLFVENAAGVFVEATGQTLVYSNGTLNIAANGTYTFTPNATADGSQATSFNYKLIAANGDESNVATLTINLGRHYETGTGNDLISGTSGNDVYTTGTGADTVIFNLLNATDSTGGNGSDTWSDFNKVEGDKIDISTLLSGQSVNNTNIGQYVTATQVGADTVISIDRDGSGISYNSTEILTLKNTTTTIDELLQNSQILF